MSENEIKELKKLLVLTASYYGRDLKPEVVAMMANDLDDLDFVEVSAAFQSYRRDPKNRVMPLPAQIREIVEPIVTNDSHAREIVERIKFAIGKFGYMNSQGASEYIGEIGWQLVRNMGGWHNLCSSDFISNPALIAQMRQSAVDHVNYGPKLKVDLPQIGFKTAQVLELEETNKIQTEKSRQVTELLELLKKAGG